MGSLLLDWIKRPLAWVVIGVMLVAAVVLLLPTLARWYARGMIETALAEHTRRYQEQITTLERESQRLKARLQTDQAAVDRLKQREREVAKQAAENEKERKRLLAEADRLNRARSEIAKEVSRVPDKELVSQIRRALDRLRVTPAVDSTGGGGPAQR